MSKKHFGGAKRKRSRRRGLRIDSWERLQLVVELIKSTLPIDINMDLYNAEVSMQPVTPLPFDPRSESSTTVPMPVPFLAEVRVSLYIDETIAWLLPVQFSIDQVLMAEEVITKLADALEFLKAWSQVHGSEGRKHLRTRRLGAQRRSKSSKYLIQ